MSRSYNNSNLIVLFSYCLKSRVPNIFRAKTPELSAELHFKMSNKRCCIGASIVASIASLGSYLVPKLSQILCQVQNQSFVFKKVLKHLDSIQAICS
jgi:hypothetical protein